MGLRGGFDAAQFPHDVPVTVVVAVQEIQENGVACECGAEVLQETALPYEQCMRPSRESHWYATFAAAHELRPDAGEKRAALLGVEGKKENQQGREDAPAKEPESNELVLNRLGHLQPVRGLRLDPRGLALPLAPS